MHKLDRTVVAAPDCLAEYDYREQNWDNFGGACKKQLRFALVQFQGIPGVTVEGASEYGVRCSYCECGVYNDGHIEHFRRKNPRYYPEFTFEWTNLFLACGANEHCGHYKDSQKVDAYDPANLIKPDERDPDHYLYFHSSGEVRVREGLNDEDKLIASETIRVFGLKNGSLTGERARAVSTYKGRVLEELDEIASWTPAEREEYLQGEIDATRWQPYSTTIKHFLLSNG